MKMVKDVRGDESVAIYIGVCMSYGSWLQVSWREPVRAILVS